MLKRMHMDYKNSETHKQFVSGIEACPEDAGCYEAYRTLVAFQDTVELTENIHTAIEAAAERWHRLSNYCPHCSKVAEKNRNTTAYQNYKQALKRVSQRLGVPPVTVLGIEVKPDPK